MQTENKVKSKGILFIESSIPPSRGGVQRVSWLLAENFKRFGYDICFAFWLKDYDKVPKSNKIRYNEDESVKDLIAKFSQLVQECHVCYIICQGVFSKKIYDVLLFLKQKYHCKLISCLHNNPGFEKYRETKKNKLQLIKDFIKRVFFPWKIKNMYREFYNLSDKFVLLSDSYIEDFLKLNKINDSQKLCSIANPLTFEDSISEEEIAHKKDQVLIISRLEEVQKNINSALRIWKTVEESGKANDWNLILGGYGPDEHETLEYAKELGLHSFRFIGKVEDAQKWYKESKIFMMTSRYEGFPMTILETVQNACIPIAYDSYSSVHDIIQNGQNGFLIKNNDEQSYANTMLKLMSDEKELQIMAINALESSKRFSISTITSKWLALFEELK